MYAPLNIYIQCNVRSRDLYGDDARILSNMMYKWQLNGLDKCSCTVPCSHIRQIVGAWGLVLCKHNVWHGAPRSYNVLGKTRLTGCSSNLTKLWSSVIVLYLGTACSYGKMSIWRSNWSFINRNLWPCKCGNFSLYLITRGCCIQFIRQLKCSLVSDISAITISHSNFREDLIFVELYTLSQITGTSNVTWFFLCP